MQRRIAENKARIASLGIAETVHSLTAEEGPKRKRYARRPVSEAAKKAPRGPVRRSRRVAGEDAENAENAENAGDVFNYEAPEVHYNEEKYSLGHVEALGSAKTPWVLFRDGYDSKGNRLYDKAAGLTCHQCRQKTLGKRTACSKCESLHGVFCGDCLWMRYGENVDEVMAEDGSRAAWVCPPCRDLCNCSFCRSRKGWCPTGTLYRRAVAEGYRSVAHYLVCEYVDEEDAEAVELVKELKIDCGGGGGGGDVEFVRVGQ